MRAVDILYENYSSWLQEHAHRCDKKILRNFRRIAENFQSHNTKKDNKSIYLSTHVHFLVHSLALPDPHPAITFPLGIILLNSLLKDNPKVRIPLTCGLILAFKHFFSCWNGDLKSGGLASSALWLICKCLQGTEDKRAALVMLGESGLISDFLRAGELEAQSEKPIAMLLYFISKHV
jgi:hypothetical protein